MNNFTQILKDAFEYYDENQMNYYDLIKKFKYYKINKITKHIIFYDSEKKIIYESDYEMLGRYIHTNNIWIWAWALGKLRKNAINISRKLLNYALDLDDINIPLKIELITSRHILTEKEQLEIHLSLASYLSKQPFIIGVDIYDVSASDPIDKTVKILKKGNIVITDYIVLLQK